MALFLVILAIAVDAAQSANVFFMTALRDRIEGIAKERLFSQIVSVKDLGLFEDPARLNALNLAEQAIPRYQQVSDRFASFIYGVFGAVPALVISGTIAWWIPVLICATLLPAGIVQFRLESQVWNAEATLAEARRRQGLVEETLTRPAYAKDVRLFSLAELLVGTWRGIFQQNVTTLNAIRMKGLRTNLLWSLFGAIGLIVPLISIVNGVVNGQSSLGELVLLLGIVFAVRSGFQDLIWSCSEITGMTLAMEHYESFLADTGALPVTDPEEVAPTSVPPLQRELVLDDMGFSYPGSTGPAIADISLRIAQGSTVAVVGENGAGKSTLAKLLGRLYAPSVGTVRWDGHDIAGFDIDAYRARLGFMTQDIAEPPFSLRENLAFARLADPPDDVEIGRALQATELAAVAERSELGLDTPLTKEIDGGTQLSGGQWQRLALARVMLRAPNADLLVLDEPTAAFDPASEHTLIGQLLAISRGRTAIIITHRLALCTEVDRVIVMHQGRVIEDGTHAELLSAQGHYAAMFHAQAHRYQREAIPFEAEQKETP
jgi:ATP-binding cassette subfamily B protein